MENATKALLIAAGVLISIMVLSLLLIAYGNISNYYKAQHETAMTEQNTQFNSQYEGYNRKNVRGTDLLSLMNKVINYNSEEHYAEGTKYPRIMVTININDTTGFYYKNDEIKGSKYDLIQTKFSNNEKSDDELIKVTQIESKLINDYAKYNLSADKLQKLSANISNIFISEKANINKEGSILYAQNVNNRLKRKTLLESILGKDKVSGLNLNSETGETTSGGEIISDIKQISYEYYQYMQFKRAKFDCNIMEYDTNTGRIDKIEFTFTGNFN